MRKMVLSFVFLTSVIVAFTQSGGIEFKNEQSWEQLKVRARRENKYIFIDVFATWCGPCKEMDRKVYPSEKAGDFINSKFISVKVQMDQTKEDSKIVKAWYEDAKEIAREYEIFTYPTTLFFSPSGKLLKKSSGYLDADSLIKAAEESIYLNYVYNTRLKQFKQGKLNNAEIKELALLAKSYKDLENAQKVADNYINDYLFKLPENELLTKDNIKFMGNFLGNSDSKTFRFFLRSSDKINQVLGEYHAQNKIMDFIEEFYLPDRHKWEVEKPDWDAIEKKVTAKFGPLGKERVYEQRMMYYFEVTDWLNYSIWYRKYLENYLQNARYDVNNLSWILFEHSDDQEVLKYACDTIMPYSLEKWYSNDAAAIDTYANLLYKTGRKEKAIEWEEKAVKLSRNDKVLVEYLDKMRRGVRTW